MKSCPLCNKTYETGDVCPDDGAVLLANRPVPGNLVGQVLKGAYRIEERISQGGMGVVYRATQIRLGRHVAVKVILPHFQSTPEVIKRFFQEARLLSQLNHPNIVSIIDFGNTESGLIYMVMEYLEGMTLRRYVPRQHGLPIQEIIHIMLQLCQGIEAAHQYSIIHRDLKPSNIFLARIAGGGYVTKILDFGIGKTLEGGEDPAGGMTRTGMILGTPGYISPEQIEGTAKPGIQSDIYALGGILYFMLSGRRPYHEDTDNSALLKQLSVPPSPIDTARLNESACTYLIPAVAKAMATAAEDRYTSAGDFVKAIRELARKDQSGSYHRVQEHISSGSPLTLSLIQPGVEPDRPTREAGERKGGGTPGTPSGSAQQPTHFVPTQPLEPARPSRKPSRRQVQMGGAVLLVLVVLIGLIGFLPEAWSPADTTPAGTLHLGMSAAFSGPARELGRDMQVGIETYFRAVNDSGGVHGHILELTALDDGYEPDRALQNMQTLVEEHDVFAVIGNVGTPTAEVTVPFAMDRRKLFFGAFTGADLLRKDPPDRYVFNYRASYAQETAAMMHYFVEVKGIAPSEVAVFAQNDSYGDAGFRGVSVMLRHYDYQLHDILRVGYERNSVDVDEAVASILSHSTQVRAIVMVATYKPAARFIQQLKDAGLDALFANVSFVGSQALAEEFREIGSSYAEGVIVTQVVPHYAAQTTGVLAYQDHLARYAPAEQPGFVSLEGYVTAKLFVEGLRRADELTTEGVIDALERIQNLDLGMGGIINLGPSQHQASDKVWGTVLDDQAEYHILDLEAE